MDGGKYRVLILGKNGQLGQCFFDLIKSTALQSQKTMALLTEQEGSYLNEHVQFIGTERAELDLAEIKSIQDKIARWTPDLIVNCTAYTQVDRAESEGALAETINSLAVGQIAEYCHEHSIPCIHFSTDYVFDGRKGSAYTEDDMTSPLGTYGLSKLNGEKQLISRAPMFFIFRTSWVYSAFGNNFLKTMLRLGQEREKLSIVGDQIGAPTCAHHLAESILQLIVRLAKGEDFSQKFGVYHLAGPENVSWYDFAQRIFKAARALEVPTNSEGGMPLNSPPVKKLLVAEVVKITTDDYPTPAQRPKNSRLAQEKVKFHLGLSQPSLDAGISLCLRRLYGNT